MQWVLAWDHLGEPSDPRPWEWRRSQELTHAEVAAFAREVASGPFVVSILGDASRIERDALAAIAPVEDVTPEELFSFGPFPEP